MLFPLRVEEAPAAACIGVLTRLGRGGGSYDVSVEKTLDWDNFCASSLHFLHAVRLPVVNCGIGRKFCHAQ